MKFAFATVLASTMGQFAMGAFFDVDVYPSCKGVDFTSLTDAEETFVAESLMLSYNQVHMLWDGGDKYLSDIQPVKEALMADGKLGQSGGSGGNYGGTGGCGWCDNSEGCMDDFYTWRYDDDSIFCSNNDLVAEMMVGKGGKKKSKVDHLWDKTFTQKLQEGPYPSLQAATECDISMDAHKSEDPPAAFYASMTGLAETKSANVFVNCQQGDLKGLSDDEKETIAVTLVHAYKQTHASGDELFNLDFDESVSMTNGCGFTAEWGCRRCDNAANAYLRGKEKSWSDVFVYNINKTIFPALKELNKCKITWTVSAKNEVAESHEVVEEGAESF